MSLKKSDFFEGKRHIIEITGVADFPKANWSVGPELSSGAGESFGS